METNDVSGEHARQALAQAAADRAGFARTLTLPPGYSLLTGTGNAVFVFGIALGNSDWRFGSLAFVVGLAVQATAAALAMRRFREHNGAWVSGISGTRPTHLVILAFLATLVPCIVVSTWLMVRHHGVASALVAGCALPLTAAADRWWMARYHAAR